MNKHIAIVAGLGLAGALCLAVVATDAFGRPNAAWDENSAEIKEWYENLTQPDNPPRSCCGEADAYWADSFKVGPNGEYVAVITDDREIPGRPHIEPGTEIPVPNRKLKYDAGNPTGHGVIFVHQYTGGFTVYCYITPSAG
jgi:hypothetical protein